MDCLRIRQVDPAEISPGEFAAAVRAEVEGRAIEALIVDQLRAAMAEGKITKSEMARRMHTPRAQLERLLDPENEGVTLTTLQRAAHAVGRTLRLELA